MFVQSERFVKAHGGRVDDISIYGQESHPTTWRLAAMNLAIRGFAANLGKEPGDTFANDQFPDLKFDYVMANPPFNLSEWGGEKHENDPRWKFGRPPIGNANFAWMQHILWKLKPGGSAGVILGNNSLSSDLPVEIGIRSEMIKSDVIDAIILLPSKIFRNTTTQVCIWILTQNKGIRRLDRSNTILMINAETLWETTQSDRTLRTLSLEHIEQIASAYKSWKEDEEFQETQYFSRSVPTELIVSKNVDLSPLKYIDKPSSLETNNYNRGIDQIRDDLNFCEENLIRTNENLTSVLKNIIKSDEE